MKLSLSRSEADDSEWPDSHITDRLAAIAASLAPENGRVDVILVADDFIRTINRDYRGVDRATDVISFSYIEDMDKTPDDDLAGEIYVSHETLSRDAASQQLEPDHLFLRIGVHGLLHVVGYEHTTDEQAHQMEAEERRLLAGQLNKEQVEALF